jgi:copper chaperone CopZ
MIAFEVLDMFSSRSAGTIVKTLKALDGGARVRVNMETCCVEIEPRWAHPDAFREAIGKAGFTAVAVPQQSRFADEVDVFLPLD